MDVIIWICVVLYALAMGMAIWALFDNDQSAAYGCRICGERYGTLNGADLCCEPYDEELDNWDAK